MGINWLIKNAYKIDSILSTITSYTSTQSTTNVTISATSSVTSSVTSTTATTAMRTTAKIYFLSLKMKLEQNFTATLNDSSSSDYISLKQKIQNFV